jgi:DNA-binding CsgD family transcriptional regulator
MADRAEVPGPADSVRSGRVASLNGRDVEVLRCLADGRSTSEIAGLLDVSSNTARTRIRRVQARLDVTDRAAAVRTAQDLGVVGIPRPRRPLV